MITKQEIPQTLKSLVYFSIEILGEQIKKKFGQKTFSLIEKMRKDMKLIRDYNLDESIKKLSQIKLKIHKLPTDELRKIAHSYGLMLELINRCESSYRTYRIHQTDFDTNQKYPDNIIFVFTAHPTEARSKEFLAIFEKIYLLFLQYFRGEKSFINHELSYYLQLALDVPIAPHEKPTVADEADHLYSFILKKNIIDQQIQFLEKKNLVGFRSWVGSDKDGHPFVTDKTLKQSFTKSRFHLLNYINDLLEKTASEIKQFQHNQLSQENLQKIINVILNSLKEGEKLLAINKEDYLAVENFKKIIDQLTQTISHDLKKSSYHLEKINQVFILYPYLVIPQEVREDSAIVKLATTDSNETIFKMLAYLQEISSSNSAKWYVRGLILSQVESEHDLNFAYLLQKNIFKKLEIPIVPLFETSQSLLNSCVILEKFFKTNPEILIEHQNRWSSRFEVMVGYSDSGKESGILKGRFLIQKSLMMLEKYLSKKKLVPIYFHGSGGSIERGGGTIQEQTSWWPTSSLNNYKCTIQGEMIARSFMSSPIFLSQINQINKSFLISQNNKKDKDNISEDKNFENFCMEVGKNYETLIHDPNFVKNIVDATPYNFLDILKIGSRPTKRQTEGFKLRAIPWILCWTQTRLLLPTWIGVGPAFKSLSHQNKLKLRKTYQTNFMFRSYIHQLGFTLKKVELSIWYHYLLNKTQNKAQAEILFKPFEIEFNETIKFFKFITQEKNLTFYRPWLGESIYFRSSMIHPLNLIQMEAVNRKDELLLRETVTGISCGMMTTG